jgi:two-component sensor histidine kinase
LRIVFFILIIIQSFALYAQPRDENLTDSLKKIILRADSDSSLYSAYLNLSYYYQFNEINPARAIEYSIAANKISGKLKSKQKTAKALLCLGQAFSMDNKISQAKEALFQALKIFIDIQDSSLQAYTQAYIGITFYYQGKLDSCLYWNLEALKIETKLNNTVRIANIYSNMAIAEEITTDKRKGIEYYKNAFLLFYSMKDFSNAATTINNIGEAFVNLKQYDSALYYVKKALLIATENKLPSQQMRSYLTIGLCYNGIGEYKMAINFFKRISLDPETQFDFFIYSNYLLGCSQSYLGLAKYEIAIKLAKKGLALKSVGKNNHYGIFADFYLILSKAYEGLHNNKYAFLYFRKYKSFNDSLLNLKNIENMNELSSKFEFQQKQYEIDLLKKNNELKDLLIISNKRSTFVYVSILFILLFVIVALLVFYSEKQKSAKILVEKNTMITTALTERELLLKEIHHRVKNNLQVISSLLNMQCKKITDLNALEALKEAKNRIKTMALIHQNLYADKNLTNVNTREYIQNLISSLFASYNLMHDEIELVTDIDLIKMNIDTLVSLGLILNELISNTLKHAFIDAIKGEIEVKLKKTPQYIILEVNDNGKGLPPEWNKQSSSLGYEIIYSFIKKVKGKIEINTEDGTRIKIFIDKDQKL